MTTRSILAAALLSVAASGNVTAVQEAGFANAMLVGGEIEFDVFDASETISWVALAPKEWTDFELPRVTPEFLALLRENRNMFNEAEMVFYAPLPKNFSNRHFYFVSENGIQELRGDRLKGTLRFSFGRNGELVDRMGYGSIVGLPIGDEASDPGGFVIAFDDPHRYEIDESTRQDIEFVPEAVRGDWDSRSEEDREFWTVQRKYVFRFQGQAVDYVFVHWAPDRKCHEGCCGLRYSVFIDEDPPVQVSSLSAQCDV